MTKLTNERKNLLGEIKRKVEFEATISEKERNCKKISKEYDRIQKKNLKVQTLIGRLSDQKEWMKSGQTTGEGPPDVIFLILLSDLYSIS